MNGFTIGIDRYHDCVWSMTVEHDAGTTFISHTNSLNLLLRFFFFKHFFLVFPASVGFLASVGYSEWQGTLYIYIQKCWLLAGDVCFFFFLRSLPLLFCWWWWEQPGCMPGREGAAPPPNPLQLWDFWYEIVWHLWFCFCCFFLFVTLFVVCSCWWFAIDCYIVCYVIRNNVCDIILYFDIFWYPLWYFFSFATRFLTWCCF